LERLNKPNICVVTIPFSIAVGIIQLANFLELLEPLSAKIFAITGNFPENPNKNIHIINLRRLHRGRSSIRSLLGSTPRFILNQLEIMSKLIKLSKSIDIVMFYIGARMYVLPVLLARLLGKKVIVFANGSMAQDLKFQYGKRFLGLGMILSLAAGMIEHTSYSLANQVAADFDSAVHLLKLDRYRKKISIGLAPYIDTGLLKMNKRVNERGNCIGYIGRLEENKGVMNFIKAMPLIVKERDDVDFLIGGDGTLSNKIVDELKRSGVSTRARLTGMIPPAEIAGYFNQVKLLVFPAYNREGGAGVVKEGMSCGAIIVATPVGGVPDLITDGETGFIMEDNSPECIARNVIRALEYPRLEEIAQNARKLIEEEYTYQSTVEKFRQALNRLAN